MGFIYLLQGRLCRIFTKNGWITNSENHLPTQSQSRTDMGRPSDGQCEVGTGQGLTLEQKRKKKKKKKKMMMMMMMVVVVVVMMMMMMMMISKLKCFMFMVPCIIIYSMK